MKSFVLNVGVSVLLLLLCSQAYSAVDSQPPLTQYPLLTQDSVYTRIENGKAITTFKVTAPSSSYYILEFWLMGVKHTNSTYSSYAMRIDNNPVSDYVTTDRGDWHVYGPDNSTLTYFTQGQHEIHLEGTLADVPNAERVITRSSLNDNSPFMNANERYAKMKNHEDYTNIIVYGEDPLETNYRAINYNDIENDTASAPFFYNAELNKEVYYTFFRLEYYTKNQVVSITTDEVNGVGHVLNVFSKSNPYSYTWVDSTYNGHANLSINIPKTDFYYVMVRTKSPNNYGTCSMTINNDRRFEGVPICNSRTSFQHVQYGYFYSCFAKSSVGDPMIMLISTDGYVRDFNDDYVVESDYEWGKNARFDGLLWSNWWLLTTAKSYPPEVLQRFDIYVGCKSDYYEDKICSSVSTFNYNCVSWSVGVWTIWINPKKTIEGFDTLYASCGYVRTTDADLSIVDIWKRNNVFTHASIKSKANPYAAGYDWESKDGAALRFFHPRYSLSGYGQVAYHYKKLYSGGVYPYYPFLSFVFTQQETEQIENGLNLVTEATKERYNALLSECYQDKRLMRCSNTHDFPDFDSYRKLLDFCMKTPNAEFLLYKEIGERNVLPVKLLQDIAEKRNPQILKEVEKQCERLSKGDSVKAIRNVQADGMLLAKLLLSGSSEPEDMIGIAEEDVAYSSDKLLDVSVDGYKLDIAFDLEHDATATVIIGSTSGLNIKRIADRKSFQAGQNHLHYLVPQPGIYTVSLMVNGGLYEKKVYVK